MMLSVDPNIYQIKTQMRGRKISEIFSDLKQAFDIFDNNNLLKSWEIMELEVQLIKLLKAI